ncbi:hypothetical protein [Salaquimonas pukyongi]|nr:hypothetical protein [Salaquimonas pukyongi]
MAHHRKTSGLEKVPPFLTRPVWKDPLFWWAIAAAVFWGVVIWWFFWR